MPKREFASIPETRASPCGVLPWRAHIIDRVIMSRLSTAWALNPNWPAGLRYVVAGLGQLGRIEEAETALAELKAHDPGLARVEHLLVRFYQSREGVDHLLDGLRKAGMPEE